MTRRERAAAFLVAALGVGARLAFTRALPTLPFWDSLQLIHFGQLIRDQGLAAAGWYWGQFNPGLPVLLGLLFKTGLDPYALARSATAIATGLLGLLPLLLWRGVVAFRWRLLAGSLLALWPGQVFFSGVVAQDNWVLPPTVALACLAVRRLRDPGGRGHPLAAALLWAAAFAVRQEMLVVLLPLAIPAGTSAGATGSRRRDLAILVLVSSLAALLLASQRREATGRFAISTEHGALGLFGSFMPGSSVDGWIDARAYAAALDPSIRPGLFGSQRQLILLTWEEIRRRPGFHLLRVASWFPRLALEADADDLFWSVGGPRAVAPVLRSKADGFRKTWRPLLLFESAAIQGLFAAALFAGIRRRRPDILVLGCAIALKFAIHTIVSPLGRLVLPAVSLELLAIALGAAVLEGQGNRMRFAAAAVAAMVASGLLFLTPRLASAVIRLDSFELPRIRSFSLDAGNGCLVPCRLERGMLTGLTPTHARWEARSAGARLECSPPILERGRTLSLHVEGPVTPEDCRVETDGIAVVPQREPDGTGEAFRWPDANVPHVLSIELFSPEVRTIRFSIETKELEGAVR